MVSAGLVQDEVVRLPAVEPAADGPAGTTGVRIPTRRRKFCSAGRRATWPPLRPRPVSRRLPPGGRDGVFQKLLFDATYLAPGGTRPRPGHDDVQLQGIFAAAVPHA